MRTAKDRTAMIVAIVAIILIIIMGVTAGQREGLTKIEEWVGNIISPVQGVFSTGVNALGEGFGSLFNFSKINKENKELKKQLEELQSEVINLRLERDELEELRSLRFTLNQFEEEENYQSMVANVIAKSPSNWFNVFTIDVGTMDGVTKDSIIVAANGLVGKVYEVGGNWAKVVSIIDNNSSVSFQILRDNSIQGIISGSISNELSGYLFDTMADVMIGDKLITSGIGIYPKGILIGEIKGINQSGNQLTKNIEIEPAVNFKRITKVLVMKPTVIE
ncbi:rod shape-determining protein MreC [Alkaliphilus serpentinus]|uniref:Cell shape-determining protein MreC n=1 Tax=Alkaliphilus serpentinus TaxID=1482731 RepID=A0A833M7W5_9FIRM|nr:rod shape-determining protein MreC [Alkaliphilus serpentinus]KAB3531442.1 rod shape-determining protein MreC [Alkaliphilus serpentinus]